MIPLDSQALQLQILNFVLALIEQGQIRPLLEYGINPEALDRLRELRASDMNKLSEKPLGMGLEIDPVAFQHAIYGFTSRVTREVQLEWFLRAGAPALMMEELFGLSRIQVFTLRKSLGVKASAQGVSSLPQKVRAEIETAWLNYIQRKGFNFPEEEFWIGLYEKYEGRYTLNAIHAAIKTFELIGGVSHGQD